MQTRILKFRLRPVWRHFTGKCVSPLPPTQHTTTERPSPTHRPPRKHLPGNHRCTSRHKLLLISPNVLPTDPLLRRLFYKSPDVTPRFPAESDVVIFISVSSLYFFRAWLTSPTPSEEDPSSWPMTVNAVCVGNLGDMLQHVLSVWFEDKTHSSGMCLPD